MKYFPHTEQGYTFVTLSLHCETIAGEADTPDVLENCWSLPVFLLLIMPEIYKHFHITLNILRSNLYSVKILITAHAQINGHPHNLGLKIGEFFFFTFFLEIQASNKCPPVNLEKKILLLPHAFSLQIYCLIIKQTSPFLSLGPNKRYEHETSSPLPSTMILLKLTHFW